MLCATCSSRVVLDDQQTIRRGCKIRGLEQVPVFCRVKVRGGCPDTMGLLLDLWRTHKASLGLLAGFYMLPGIDCTAVLVLYCIVLLVFSSHCLCPSYRTVSVGVSWASVYGLCCGCILCGL